MNVNSCGAPTFACVLLLLFTGALYASAENDKIQILDADQTQPLVRLPRSGQRSNQFNPSWINVSGGRQGRIDDSAGEPRPIPNGQPGSIRRQGRNRNNNRGGNRNRNRERGNDVSHRRDNGRNRASHTGHRRLDRRTIGLVYRLSNASTPFAFQLFSKIRGDLRTDIVFSPHSVHSALTMTSLGARGRTQREMLQTLGLRAARLRRQREHRAYHALLTSLKFTHRDVHVLTANAVFVKPNIPLEATFRQQLQQMYTAKFDTFRVDNPSGPETPINSWVSNMTKGKINNLVPRGSIDDLTAMILINTLYINASWAHPFNPRLTTEEIFQTPNLGPRNLPMMKNNHVYRYANHHDTEVIEIPYKGDRLALYVLLPHASRSIQELMEQVTAPVRRGPSRLEVLLQDMSPTFLSLSLPKFKTESGVLDLSESLKELGIKKAFSTKRNKANFSGISIVKLHIDQVVHKAMIEVREGGTTASAATAVYFSTRSRPEQLPTTEVKVNRPFIYVIKDKLMNAVLFLGAFLGQTSQDIANLDN